MNERENKMMTFLILSNYFGLQVRSSGKERVVGLRRG